MTTVVIVPAYNEEQTVADVVRTVRSHGHRVVVIDDGSTDATGDRARDAGATVYRHAINRGLGAALGTGFAAASAHHDADIVVTFDADGQHRAQDIPALVAPIHAGRADVVIGARVTQRRAMPWSRRIGNVAFNVITWMLFGVWTRDSQSGFRAFSRRAIADIEVKGDRMEVSSELLAQARRRGLVIAEVPIEPIYTGYSLSKGQGVAEGTRTFFRLLARRILP